MILLHKAKIFLKTALFVTYPGSHLAGAPDGRANLGPHLPRTRGYDGCDGGFLILL